MARPKQSRPIEVHRDDGYRREDDDPFAMNMDESQDPLEESGCTRDDSSEEEEVEESVAEDIARFESSFRDITKRYRLINRIGEGWSSLQDIRMLYLLIRLQGRFPPSTKQRICNTTVI